MHQPLGFIALIGARFQDEPTAGRTMKLNVSTSNAAFSRSYDLAGMIQ